MAPRISLLGTGGTISTASGTNGAVPQHGAEDLANWTSGTAELRARDVLKVSSSAITPSDMYALAEAVRQEIADGADGVVITHGTDTMEETAYALALLLDTPVPVVLTGAMRPPHSAGSDGPANLVAAVAAAAHPPLAGYGPVIVHQDEIHAARWVTKLHSTRVAAFASPAAGPVGHVVEGRVVLLLGPPPGTDRLPTAAAPCRRVELIWAAAGVDGLVVDAIAELVDGLVVAGTGGGHVPPPLAEALARVVGSGRPVVLGSRCADGRLLSATYGGAGSEVRLLADGLVSARSLSPVKARLRLIFGLSAGMRATELFPTDESDR
jgi:L-asparaginase